MYAKLIGLAALVAASGFTGWKLRDADYQEHLRKDAQAALVASEGARKEEHKAEAMATQVRTVVAVQQAKERVVYQTIVKEIPVYVPSTAPAVRAVDDAGGLPAGFVWLHNQAATGSTAPLPPGVDPGAPSGVGLPALGETIAGNYAVCRSQAAELAGWNAWYQQLVKQYEETAPPDHS